MEDIFRLDGKRTFIVKYGKQHVDGRFRFIQGVLDMTWKIGIFVDEKIYVSNRGVPVYWGIMDLELRSVLSAIVGEKILQKSEHSFQ